MQGTIDTRDPLADHPLNVGRLLWLCGVPGWSGGGTWFDLCRRNNGTLTTSPTWAGTPYGLGLSFDGTSRYVGLSGFSARPTHAAAVWANPADANRRFAFGDYDAGGSNPGVAVYSQSGQWAGMVRTATTGTVTITGGVATSGAWSRVLVSYDGTTVRLFVDGRQVASSAATGDVVASPGSHRLGVPGGYTGGFLWSGQLTGYTAWDRAPNAWADYTQSRRDNPDTVRRLRPWSFGVAGATAYTLTASAGTFTLTGQAAGLKASRTIAAGVGNYTLSGQAAGLRAARTLAATAGAYSLTGQAAGLRAARTLSASVGTFALTGQSAGLAATRALSAAAGSLVLSGQIAGLMAARHLTAGAGSFTLTGQTTGLRAARVLTATSATFALTGQAVTLAWSGGAAEPPRVELVSVVSRRAALASVAGGRESLASVVSGREALVSA